MHKSFAYTVLCHLVTHLVCRADCPRDCQSTPVLILAQSWKAHSYPRRTRAICLYIPYLCKFTGWIILFSVNLCQVEPNKSLKQTKIPTDGELNSENL